MMNRWGNSERLYFEGLQHHCRWWLTAVMKSISLLLERKATIYLDSILKSRDIILLTKVHLVKATVFPVVMCGCDSWIIKKAECWRTDAFEHQGKGKTEDETVGWYHRLNGREFEQTPGVGDGQGSLACSSPWGRKESDMTEQLNWVTQPLRIRLPIILWTKGVNNKRQTLLWLLTMSYRIKFSSLTW